MVICLDRLAAENPLKLGEMGVHDHAEVHGGEFALPAAVQSLMLITPSLMSIYTRVTALCPEQQESRGYIRHLMLEAILSPLEPMHAMHVRFEKVTAALSVSVLGASE